MAQRTRIAGAALTCALATVASAGLADIIKWKTVGGWEVSFYPDAEGCQAFALFEDDTAYFIGFDNTDNFLALDVTLLDERWQSIEDGKEYEIEVKFGNESPWTLDMDGLDIDGYPGLNIMIDASSDEAELFIREFQRETSMRWSYGSALLGHFTLRGSRLAFDEVISCQRSYLESISDQSDPFASSGSKKDPFAD